MRRPTRRQFVVGAGTAGLTVLAGCTLPFSQPQQPARVVRIGVLSPIFPGANLHWTDAFRQGLRELGYVEGQNLLIEWRYGEGRQDRIAELAAELVRLPVEVIVTWNTLTVHTVKEVTTATPVVFALVGDPVGSKLVASLARPGGNVTGLSAITWDLSAKRLELLKETVPRLSRVAVLYNPGPSTIQQLAETRKAAEALGLQVQALEVLGADQFANAFEVASRQGVEAMDILGDPLMPPNVARLADLALSKRLPAMYVAREFPAAGGLMAYGANTPDMFRRAAYYVDRILKGAKPADLPVEQPMRFDFVVNMKTARELGITFPHEVALQITEVVE